MRSLRKLSHQRNQPVEDQLRFLREQVVERRREGRRKRLGTWLRTLLPLVGIALLAWGVFLMSAGLRRTADALAVAEEVVVRAPARVKVLEVFVRPGELCRANEPLLSLAAVEGAEELRLAELELERARRRLDWFDAGGDLAAAGEPLRGDHVFEARRQLLEAEEAGAAAGARAAELRAERAALRATRASAAEERAGRGAVLEERIAEAAAELEVVQAGLDASRFDARAARELSEAGAGARREAVARAAAERVDERGAEARAAGRRALERELESTRAVDALAGREDAAALAALDARLATAELESEACARRAALWRAELDRQTRLDPSARAGAGSGTDAGPDAARVRALAREVHAVEVRLAEAQLARLQHELGDRVVTAPADGVVAWVAAAPGTVVEEDVLLVRLHAHGTLRLVAYPVPEIARELPPGTPCRVFPEDGGEVLEGRVASVAAEWVPRPSGLPERAGAGADLRVPLEVIVDGEVGSLVPGARCKLLFDQSAQATGPRLPRAE